MEDEMCSQSQPVLAARQTSAEPSDLEAAIKRLVELAEGFECGAYIEAGVQALLEPDYRAFHEDSRTDLTLRRVRAGNESRTAHQAYVKDAAAIRLILSQLRDQP